MSLQTFLFHIQTLPSKCFISTISHVSGQQLLPVCCSWGVRQGWVLMAVLWKASSHSSISIPEGELLCSFNNKKTIKDPSSGGASARLTWEHAHGWIYQASYSCPRKCRVTFGMCLTKATKSEHLLRSRQVLIFRAGFQHLCTSAMSFVHQSTIWDVFWGVENSVSYVSQCIWSPAQKHFPCAQLWLNLPWFLRRNACKEGEHSEISFDILMKTLLYFVFQQALHCALFIFLMQSHFLCIQTGS